MQTHRFTPRLLASLITLLWLVSFGYGTYALARIDSAISSRLEQPIEVGETFWALRNPTAGGNCAGYLRAVLQPRSGGRRGSEAAGMELKLDGMFKLGLQERIIHAKTEGRAAFDHQNEMVTMRTTVRLEDGSATLSMPDFREDLQLIVRVGGFVRQIDFGRLDRVYLLPEDDGSYRLRLPRSFQGVFGGRQPGMAAPKIDIEPLAPEERAVCEAAVRNTATGPEQALVSLDQYQSLMRLGGQHRNYRDREEKRKQ